LRFFIVHFQTQADLHLIQAADDENGFPSQLYKIFKPFEDAILCFAIAFEALFPPFCITELHMYIFSIFPMAQSASIYVKYLKADLAKMKNAVSIGIYNPYTKMKS
jgi:hypothetical protein